MSVTNREKGTHPVNTALRIEPPTPAPNVTAGLQAVALGTPALAT